MTNLSRRMFTRSLAAMPLIGMASAAVAKSNAPLQAVLPLARINVGRFEVTFLSDGFIDFPYELFTGAEPEQVRQVLQGYFAAGANGVRAGFTCWLIRDGDTLILVDAGPDGTVSKTSGRLPQALAAIGVKGSDIDAVILTHLHVDHISGLVHGGANNFPAAEVYADRRDVVHFTDPAKANAAPDILKSSFAKSMELVALYPKLQRIDGEREIIRGVSTVDLSGHTPGHMGVRIEDDGQSLLLVADMLFHPAAHPVMPGIGIVFEQDKAAADAARARFFARSADEKTLLAATHMPFPGLGRVVKDGDSLRWLPADWEYQA